MKTIELYKVATGKTLWRVFMAVCLVAVFAFKQADDPQSQEKVYDKAEQMPEFQGGQEGLISYLTKSIQYPAEAKKKGTQGKVFVNFVVGKDGSVTNAKILKAVDPLLDAEALRVIKDMPSWIPGKDKGKEVAVQYTLPISFALK